MSKTVDNPCKACTTNQDCCTRLSGLMLTLCEYEKHFSSFAEELLIKKSNGFIVASSRAKGACPHWGNGGCLIYPDRPIDCRLYPYVIRHFIKRKRKVRLVFDDRSVCPQRYGLSALMPESDVRALVMSFGKKVFGEGATIIVQREKGTFSRLRHRIEAALSRRRDKAASD